jgi:hypothetical protein
VSRSRAQVAVEFGRVVLAIDGRSWNLPWQAALELGRGLLSAAKRAEEIADANRIIADQALLVRAGAPFAISDHPKILDAARNEAQWDSSLRRALPKPGARAGVEFGVPSINQEPQP